VRKQLRELESANTVATATPNTAFSPNCESLREYWDPLRYNYPADQMPEDSHRITEEIKGVRVLGQLVIGLAQDVGLAERRVPDS
jgi:hypothetical protein